MMYNKKFVSRFSDAERSELLSKSLQCLWTEEGLPGRSYLLQTRKMSEQSVKDFNLGYIPGDVNHQLAGRIIFPLYDPSGNLVVLLSRDITGSSKLPVYWHEAYEKSFYLYGMHKAKEYMRRWNMVVVTEGQMDALQFYSNKVYNVVSLGGHVLSEIQLATIHRYCEDIVLLLDCDVNRAGQNGTAKILETYKGNKIAPVYLPESYDPDRYIKERGIQSMKSLIKKSLMTLRVAHA